MNTVQKYEAACELVRKDFMKKYYSEYTSDDDYYWIGMSIGEVCGIGNEFWNVDNMVDALKYKPTDEQLFSWYYDEHLKPEGQSYNLKNYIKIKTCKTTKRNT